MKLGSGSLGLGEALCPTWAYGIVLVMLKLLPAVFMSLVAYQLVMNSCARDCEMGARYRTNAQMPFVDLLVKMKQGHDFPAGYFRADLRLWK